MCVSATNNTECVAVKTIREIEALIAEDWLVHVAALHWAIAYDYGKATHAQLVEPARFTRELAVRIYDSSAEHTLNKTEVLYLAHWHSILMLREQYAKLVK